MDYNSMEFRPAPTEFKAGAKEGEYKGHFSVFGNVDDGGDIAERGMFAKTLAERRGRIKVFYSHDWSKLLGPPPAVLVEDEIGLYAEGHLTLGSFWGRETWELMKDGALTEGSFGYLTTKATTDDNGYRHLKEVILFEISPTPLGMNPLTSVGAKSRGGMSLIRPHSFYGKTSPVAAMSTPWNETEILAKYSADPVRAKMAFAWMNPFGAPTDISSYRLPHHDEFGAIVPIAVIKAGEAIARMQVDIPINDIPAVKAHLAEHYEQLELTPPWDEGSTIGLLQIDLLSSLLEEIRDQKVMVTLASDKRARLTGLIESLIEESSEPAGKPSDEKNVAHLPLSTKARFEALRFSLLNPDNL